MKPNKDAGPDEILPEFIKNGDLTLKQKIHQLIVKIWKQKKSTVWMVRRNPVSNIQKKGGIENNAKITEGYPY